MEDLLEWARVSRPGFFESFTLMRRSGSLQGANGNFPRAILFGETGRTILTFNGDPLLKGYHDTELMLLPAPGDEHDCDPIEFREISFPERRLSEPNPPKCMQCHSTSLRPLWGPYEVWDGAYGQFDDSVRNRTSSDLLGYNETPETIRSQMIEYAEFRTYQGQAGLHSRYRYLRPQSSSPVAPYGDRHRPFDTPRPNLRLTTLLTKAYARNLACRIRTQGQCFEKYGELIAANLIGCRSLNAGLSHFDAEASRELGREISSIWDRYDTQNSGARIAAYLELLGIEREEWTLKPHPTQWQYFVGQFQLSDYVAERLYGQMRVANNKLPAWRSPIHDYDRSVGISTESETPEEGELRPPPVDPRIAVCQSLVEAARAKWASHVRDSAWQNACAPAPATDSPPAVARMCASCHDGHHEGIPLIPFLVRNEMRRRPDWRIRIEERISETAAANRPMPPETPLLRRERRQLSSYLRRIYQ